MGYSLTKDTKTLFESLNENERKLVAETVRVAQEQEAIKSATKTAQGGLKSSTEARKAQIEAQHAETVATNEAKSSRVNSQQTAVKRQLQSTASMADRTAARKSAIKKTVLGLLGLTATEEVVRHFLP